MPEFLVSVIDFIVKYRLAFLIYLAFMNLLAFILYAVDKAKSKRGSWRIPEARLIGVAFLGGSLGALLGMQLLRHKTLHTKFVVTIPLALTLHTLIIAAVIILSRYTNC